MTNERRGYDTGGEPPEYQPPPKPKQDPWKAQVERQPSDWDAQPDSPGLSQPFGQPKDDQSQNQQRPGYADRGEVPDPETTYNDVYNSTYDAALRYYQDNPGEAFRALRASPTEEAGVNAAPIMNTQDWHWHTPNTGHTGRDLAAGALYGPALLALPASGVEPEGPPPTSPAFESLLGQIERGVGREGVIRHANPEDAPDYQPTQDAQIVNDILNDPNYGQHRPTLRDLNVINRELRLAREAGDQGRIDLLSRMRLPGSEGGAYDYNQAPWQSPVRANARRGNYGGMGPIARTPAGAFARHYPQGPFNAPLQGEHGLPEGLPDYHPLGPDAHRGAGQADLGYMDDEVRGIARNVRRRQNMQDMQDTGIGLMVIGGGIGLGQMGWNAARDMWNSEKETKAAYQAQKEDEGRAFSPDYPAYSRTLEGQLNQYNKERGEDKGITNYFVRDAKIMADDNLRRRYARPDQFNITLGPQHLRNAATAYRSKLLPARRKGQFPSTQFYPPPDRPPIEGEYP